MSGNGRLGYTVATGGSGGAGGAVDSVNGKTGSVSITKTDVGLGSVDNVSAGSLRDRSTHTGTQSTGTVTGLDAALTQKVSRSESLWDVRWSGVVGDGVADDSAALLAAKTVCAGAGKPTLYIDASLNVRLESQVDLTRVRRIRAEGAITVAYTAGPGLIIGDVSTQRQSLDYHLSRVAHAGAQTNVALRFVGLKNGRATVQYCDYMQLYADESNPLISSIAYFDFFIGRIPKLELYGEPGTSWINENNFYGGAIDTLNITGAYGHNNNRWHGASMEGSGATLTISGGPASCNRFDLRGEGGPSVSFGAGTWANEVVLHYVSSQGVHAPNMTVTADLGVENIFCSSLDTKMVYREIAKVDARSLAFNASSEINCPDVSVPVPGFDRLALRTAFGPVMDTGVVPIANLLPITGSSAYYRSYGLARLYFDSDVALWRPTIYAYDTNGAAIDPTVTPWLSPNGGWVANAAGSYSFGSNVQTAVMTILNPAVVSIRVTVAPSSSPGTAFGYTRLLAYVQTPQPDTAVEALRSRIRRPLYQSAAPTQGLARLGRTVSGPTASYRCVSRVDTSLSSAAAASDTVINVASAAGVANGDVIGVLLDSGLTHWTTVNGAPSGTAITLTAALPGPCAVGRVVGTNRWSAEAASSAGAAPLGCPPSFWMVTGITFATSAAFTNGQMMAVPVQVPRSTTASAIGVELTAASTEATTPAVRLGLYADDGNGRPGTLVVDGGTVTVASGTTAGQYSVPINAPVTPGWYWLTAVVQGVTSAHPTLRTVGSALPVAIPVTSASTSAPKFGFSQNSVPGSLPTSWSGWTASGLVPKMMLQLA